MAVKAEEGEGVKEYPPNTGEELEVAAAAGMEVNVNLSAKHGSIQMCLLAFDVRLQIVWPKNVK